MFSSNTVEWHQATVPFKDTDTLKNEVFHVEEPEAIQDAHSRLKKILDAKYEPADLDAVCKDQHEL